VLWTQKKLQEHLTTEKNKTNDCVTRDKNRNQNCHRSHEQLKSSVFSHHLKAISDGEWRRDDIRWQTVPKATCRDFKSAVADVGERAARASNRTESTMTVHVCHTAQFACKYGRDIPCRQRKTSTASLNSIHCGTHSQ